MQSVPCFLTSRRPNALASRTLNAEFLKSSVQKIIIDSGAIDHFFSNRAYFSLYKKCHHEFQTGSGELFTAHGYGDDVLRVAHPNAAIKKVSLAQSLGHHLLSTIPLAKKCVEVLL